MALDSVGVKIPKTIPPIITKGAMIAGIEYIKESNI